jgi:hypothetical protein
MMDEYGVLLIRNHDGWRGCTNWHHIDFIVGFGDKQPFALAWNIGKHRINTLAASSHGFVI